MSANILLVDDDKDILSVFTKVLEAEGHSVVCAHNGHKAIEEIESGNFHLAVVDITMPGPAGIEILRHIKGIDKDIGTPNGTPVGTPETDGQRGPGAANIRQRIVVGDFNATPLWPLDWRMSSQFTDAAIAVARKSGCRPQRTWGPWSGAPRLLRIDHGFVTKGMRVDEFQAVPVRGSDHSAIVMDVLLD